MGIGETETPKDQTRPVKNGLRFGGIGTLRIDLKIAFGAVTACGHDRHEEIAFVGVRLGFEARAAQHRGIEGGGIRGVVQVHCDLVRCVAGRHQRAVVGKDHRKPGLAEDTVTVDGDHTLRQRIGGGQGHKGRIGVKVRVQKPADENGTNRIVEREFGNRLCRVRRQCGDPLQGLVQGRRRQKIQLSLAGLIAQISGDPKILSPFGQRKAQGGGVKGRTVRGIAGGGRLFGDAACNQPCRRVGRAGRG